MRHNDERISESANQRISESANQRISESANQRIIVYLDYATIPSLNYLIHFAENEGDQDSIRLFGLGRFVIPNSIIARYPENTFFSCYIDYKYYSPAKEILFKILENTCKTRKVEIEFHLNVSSSIDMMKEMYAAYRYYFPYIEDIRLYLYDDGTKDILNLYRLAQDPVEELERKISINYFRMSHIFTDNELIDDTICSYFWNKFYQSKYYLIFPHFIDRSSLILLKEKIKNYEEMSLSRFALLNKKQKAIILDILNIDLNDIQRIYPKGKVLLFTGTTIFDLGQSGLDMLLELHKSVIERYCRDLGESYTLVIKGHPAGHFVNRELAQSYPNAVFIPHNIPLEIFFMLGFIPDKIGGFASTSYLNLKNLDVHSLEFITDNTLNQAAYFKEQFLLMKLMRDLHIVDDDNYNLHSTRI